MTSTVYPSEQVFRSAYLSDDERYRYGLLRRWGSGPAATFVMLNPSTADGERDDPTIRRCVGFARSHGCDALIVVNLYAFRATSPTDLFCAVDPVGPENDAVLARHLASARSRLVVAAWGTHAKPDRVDRLLSMRHSDRLTCLGVTASGAPRHPLYVPGDTRLTPWRKS